MLRRLAVLLVALVFLPHAVHADDHEAFVKEHLDGLSGEAALELVKELADDTMKGRKTAFEGGSLVENWMLGKMSEFGLHPADAAGTYLEPFTFGAANTKAPIGLTVGGTKLTYGTDYFDLTYTGSGKVEGEAVFVGYGIERPDLGWDDYAGMDVKGKIVVAIRGAPAALSTSFSEERYIGYKSSKAAEKGAAGFLLVQDASASTGTIQDRFHRATLPALWISGAIADTLFAGKKTTLAELKKSRDEGKPGKGFATGVKVQMEVHATYEPNAKGHNALGAIKGRDPDLVHEIILVGAHMDHLGVGPDGQVFNGADDNASGTAVMIHLADVLTANRLRPKRTIIFCGFGAEEQGLFGSRALAERYPFKGQIVAVLNMDMVGQGEPVVRVNGGAMFPAIQELLTASIPEAASEKVEFGPFAGGGSDHAPFVERGVPAFMISTKGKHPNYHTPLDDAGAIKADCLAATAEVVGRMLLKLAMHPESLVDPYGMTRFLVQEGPRFALGAWRGPEGKPRLPVLEIDPAEGTALPVDDMTLPRIPKELGLHGALWSIVPGEQGAKEWAYLTSHDGKIYDIVRTPSEILSTWRKRGFGLLPFGSCAGSAQERAEQLASYARDGVRFVAPWSGISPADVTPAIVDGLAAACKKHGLIPDLGTLDPAGRARARGALADAPAMALLYASQVEAQQGAALHSLGPQTLIVVAGHPGKAIPLALAEGAPPMVLLDATGAKGFLALHAWLEKQPVGWDLPGSPQRKAIRAALGGNLVTWLAKAERR